MKTTQQAKDYPFKSHIAQDDYYGTVATIVNNATQTLEDYLHTIETKDDAVWDALDSLQKVVQSLKEHQKEQDNT